MDQKDHHDPKNLLEAYEVIKEAISKKNDQIKMDQIVDMIGLICQYIIWGEKKNELFIDYFCDQNSMKLLNQLIQIYDSREIQISVIKSLTMFLFNLSKPTTIHYILSHPDLNQVIIRDFASNDDELIAFYINFYKSVTMRINESNIQLFFNFKYSTFPLLLKAISFYNHKDNLVRTSVRNIVLGIIKIQNDEFQRYLQNFPFILFYIQFSCYLKDHINKINGLLQEFKPENNKLVRLLLDDQIDIFYFLEDLLQSNEQIQTTVINSMLAYSLIPGILLNLASASNENYESREVIKHCLYQLVLIYKTFTHKPLLDFLTLFLFCRQEQLPDLLKQLYKFSKLVTYNPQQSMVLVWQWEEKFLKEYSQYVYMNGERVEPGKSPTKSPLKRSQSMVAQNLKLDLDFFTNLLEGNVQFRKYDLVEEIQNISNVLGIEIIAKYENEQYQDNQSFIENSKKNLVIISQTYELLATYINSTQKMGSSCKNILPTILFSLRSKDDNESFLALTLIKTIRHSKFISHDILQITGLLTADKDRELYDSYQNQLMKSVYLEYLLKIIGSRGRGRSIQSYTVAAQLFLDYAKISQDIFDIGPELKEKLIDITKAQIEKISTYVRNSYHRIYIVDFFQNEFKSLSLNPLFAWPQVDHKLLIPEDQDKNTIDQSTSDQTRVKNDMIILIILILLINKLNGQTLTHQEEVSKMSIDSPFQYLITPRWQLGKETALIGQKKIFVCKMDKEQCSIMEDEYQLIITSQMTEKCTIKSVYNIKSLDLNSNPKNPTIVHFTTLIQKGKYIEFDIDFINSHICDEFKHMIEKSRKQIIKAEDNFILQYLSICERYLI